MIFDTFINIVEKHYKEHISTLKNAKIFDFSSSSVEKKLKTKVPNVNSDFFLPFDVIVSESIHACVVLANTVENQVGFNDLRRFLVCTSPETNGIAIAKGTFGWGEEGKVMFNIETIDVVNGQKVTELLATYNIGKLSHEEVESSHETVIDYVVSAVQEITFLNNSSNFVLEINEIGSKRKGWWKKKKPKIPSSSERPRYTILEPEKIRKILNIDIPEDAPERTHASPIPHERRRHKRWLRDIKYSYDSNGVPIEPKICPKGVLYYKTSIVPATWVGPSEAIIGSKHYKVRLDL